VQYLETMGDNGAKSESLIGAAVSDPTAFGAFYRLFERRILGFFMRATGSPELAADLAAETFARALEFVDSFDPDKGLPEQWLFGIARNVLASSWRRGQVEASARERLGMPRLEIDDHMSDAIARLAADDRATLALAELPADQREAIHARVLEDRDYEEIAAELRCSQAVVRKRVSRGLRTLRARLAEER